MPPTVSPACELEQMDAPPAFSVSPEQRGTLSVLRIHGDVDIATAPQLKEAVIAALERGAASLALDLSGVAYLDSMGLGVLISARKRATERGGIVYLIGVGDRIHRVLRLLSMEKIFQLCSEADLPQA
jgi:anti-sigma B factor antagonist